MENHSSQAKEGENSRWRRSVHRGDLDAHPLVREYFGEELRNERDEAWRESNRRLYDYYRTLAPELPEKFREMEPLFLAVIYGCHAGLYRESLQDIYIPRIQRGNASFAVNVLGARVSSSLRSHPFLRRRTMGSTGGNWRWTSLSLSGGSAFHPYAGSGVFGSNAQR